MRSNTFSTFWEESRIKEIGGQRAATPPRGETKIAGTRAVFSPWGVFGWPPF
jgi:hypothetical protein